MHINTIPAVVQRTNHYPYSLFCALFKHNTNNTLLLFFQESYKTSNILGSRYCYTFLIDDKEHKLYTFLKHDEGKEVKLMKPVDRGITRFVLSEGKGLNLDDV